MSVQTEIKKIEKAQEQCIKFFKYLEKWHPNSYDDIKGKLAIVIGTIEDLVTTYNEL